MLEALADWVATANGTPQGARAATYLALSSAFFHALFGALQKGRYDPWLSRAAIDTWLILQAGLLILLVVPAPEPALWPIYAGAIVIHFFYKLTQALAYERAAYTAVYPIVRGTGPLLTVSAAAILFSEHYTWIQWTGVLCLSGGILLLALRNIAEERIDPVRLRQGIGWALACGAFVAIYTVYDAWGIRQAANAITFLVWFFFLTSFDFAILGALRWARMTDRPPLLPLALKGLLGATIAWASFGGVMLATRLDRVGDAAVLRETSTIFAAVIGLLVLGERTGPRRVVLMALIALGAVLVERGG